MNRKLKNKIIGSILVLIPSGLFLFILGFTNKGFSWIQVGEFLIVVVIASLITLTFFAGLYFLNKKD